MVIFFGKFFWMVPIGRKNGDPPSRNGENFLENFFAELFASEKGQKPTPMGEAT